MGTFIAKEFGNNVGHKVGSIRNSIDKKRVGLPRGGGALQIYDLSSPTSAGARFSSLFKRKQEASGRNGSVFPFLWSLS
jgi:hypothetical protein